MNHFFSISFIGATTMFVFFFSTAGCLAQDINAKALAKADTSNFSVNQKENWETYNSFIERQGDSVRFEVVIRHDRSINWQAPQYFGRIKSKGLLPEIDQEIDYKLLEDIYTVLIDRLGRCYIRLTSGSLPANNPVVIPIIINYANVK